MDNLCNINNKIKQHYVYNHVIYILRTIIVSNHVYNKYIENKMEINYVYKIVKQQNFMF